MKLTAFLIFVLFSGYAFYWTFLSRGYGLLKPYLGYENYRELKSQAWLWFWVMAAVCLFGNYKAMAETQVFRVFFMPALTLGYVLGHVHFIRIPQARWQR